MANVTIVTHLYTHTIESDFPGPAIEQWASDKGYKVEYVGNGCFGNIVITENKRHLIGRFCIL